jgi:TPR repeat protein
VRRAFTPFAPQSVKSFVDNNVTEAIRLLTPLAAVGYEVAQLNLAYIYKVPALCRLIATIHGAHSFHLQEKLGRPDLAIPALRLAAGQGSPKALVTLGNFAYWGTGIQANSTYALQLFAAAGRSESAHGAFNCGMM